MRRGAMTLLMAVCGAISPAAAENDDEQVPGDSQALRVGLTIARAGTLTPVSRVAARKRSETRQAGQAPNAPAESTISLIYK